MAASSLPVLRRLWAQVHLWLAVILTILLVPVCLTGVILTWPNQFNALSNPPPRASGVASLPPSAYLAAAQKAVGPDTRLGAVTLPAREGLPVGVATPVRRGPPAPGEVRQPPRVVWLDPATAEVISIGRPGSPLFSFAHEFHETMMIEGWGRSAVGVLGGVLLLLSLTGIWLWWPRGAFLKAFAWRRTPSTMLNLHYMTGFWISVPLAIVAATGIVVSYPSLINALAPAPPSPAAAPAKAGPVAMTLDQAAETAVATVPGGALSSVAPPNGGVWRVAVTAKGARRELLVDDATGLVRAAPAPRPPGGPYRLIHQGSYSLIWKWLVTLTGIIPLLLAVTGIYVWIKLELRKAKARKAT